MSLDSNVTKAAADKHGDFSYLPEMLGYDDKDTPFKKEV